ncbi:RbsD or FucU transport [Companilactobacillus suantsaicola]|uniref:RbsD or FucU transport n=1 Tax=Companilactobacillus suantsaicola TaxID=2487723 RepID=A0A4Z0JMV1_9LACO|nr:RbsD/FucU family protein [Companilactobacillus suantsaicola]TGD24271.1 RbsD or FucU transport [Companilactobacillus suantsaicola]
MLTTTLLHPAILRAIANCGHGDKILITDGNYPLDSDVNDATEKIYLALKPDLPKVTDVLETLNTQINFEKAEVMTPGEGEQPEIYGEFKQILGINELSKLGRQEFYDACKKTTNLKLGINTGETRVFANILLTVGVR